MAALTVSQTIALAIEHLGAGRLAETEALGRKVLAVMPEHPDALHLLGIVAHQMGSHETSLSFLTRAVAANPADARLHNSVGNVLLSLARNEEAIGSFQRALQLQPAYAEAQSNLGDALRLCGQLEASAAACREALRLKPGHAGAHLNLGNALKDLGQPREAIAAYREALRLRPYDADAQSNLGVALMSLHEFVAAENAFRSAIRSQPGMASAHYNLGHALRQRGHRGAAIAAFREAIRLAPRDAEAHNSLGVALAAAQDPDAAVASYRAALEIAPDFAATHGNLALALTLLGDFEEALRHFQRAVALNPHGTVIHSTLIYALQFHPACEAGQVREEQARWNERHAAPLRAARLPHTNTRDPERRLKIGYVSADFCEHPVTFFLAGLFPAHDRAGFEIHGYSSVTNPDAITQRLRETSDRWHEVAALSDEELAGGIQREGIDILVDLAMHSAGTRLPAFARQPAPVQISWLAYPGRTGLESIDYRFTDATMDPSASEDDAGPERPLRLPDAWCCYTPIGDFPGPSPLPVSRAGHVTFGALHQASRFNDGVLRCWMRLLRAVPGARLLLHAPAGRCRERVHRFCEAGGIARERVEFVAYLRQSDYLRLYERIDIGLDPFPCNGMTTTCHALWLGAPVVTLAGAEPVARVGASLLATIGLGELVAHSEEEYVSLAAALAADLPRLASLRAGMRERMQRSPLMDAPCFTRHVEAAYRAVWREWCRGGNSKKQEPNSK